MKKIRKQKVENKRRKINSQITKLVSTALLMTLSLFLFKFIPMQIYGKNILFDASMHITLACFFLYFIYFFIDQDKSWKIPYLIFSFAVLTIISIQRILVNAHNDIGLLIGLLISLFSIAIPNWSQLKNRIDF